MIYTVTTSSMWAQRGSKKKSLSRIFRHHHPNDILTENYNFPPLIKLFKTFFKVDKTLEYPPLFF